MIFFGLNSVHSENFVVETVMKLNERANSKTNLESIQ